LLYIYRAEHQLVINFSFFLKQQSTARPTSYKLAGYLNLIQHGSGSFRIFFENIYFKSATIEAKTYSLIIAKNKLQKKIVLAKELHIILYHQSSLFGRTIRNDK
jgi:hypothetical protein